MLKLILQKLGYLVKVSINWSQFLKIKNLFFTNFQLYLNNKLVLIKSLKLLELEKIIAYEFCSK